MSALKLCRGSEQIFEAISLYRLRRSMLRGSFSPSLSLIIISKTAIVSQIKGQLIQYLKNNYARDSLWEKSLARKSKKVVFV